MRTFLVTCSLCLLITPSFGCSDGDDEDAADVHVAPDTASEDIGSDSVIPDPDGSPSDTSEDGATQDGSTETTEINDITNDITEGISDEVGEDGVDDAESDVSHFEFCPYDDPADVDCDAVCAHSVACGADLAECVNGCNASLLMINETVVAGMTSCMETTECGVLSDETTLSEYCFETVLGGLTATEPVTTVCTAVDAKADECAGGDTAVEQMCLFVLPGMNESTLSTFGACAEVDCAIFDECAHDALCGVFW